jgi:hypothetical protein
MLALSDAEIIVLVIAAIFASTLVGFYLFYRRITTDPNGKTKTVDTSEGVSFQDTDTINGASLSVGETVAEP